MPLRDRGNQDIVIIMRKLRRFGVFIICRRVISSQLSYLRLSRDLEQFLFFAAPLYWRTHHCQTRQQVAIAQLSGMYAKMYLY